MLFHTEFTPEPLPYRIGLQSRIITLGSCFAEVMGQRLADHKLDVLTNPFGTIFNPVSLAKLLTMALNGNAPDENRYIERDGIWFHYDFHSSLYAHSHADLCILLTQTLSQTAAAIRQADFLLLTPGTAVVYRHVETGKVVANCHKMPGVLFEKYLYNYNYLLDDMQRLLKMLHKANPTLNTILTVSPVRHTRDTLPTNSVSKATLRTVAHELTVWNRRIHYFPAFELMTDDLRDYRFYEADMIHPNAQAHDYIFGKFVQSAFDSDLYRFVTEWSQISKSLAHRPLYGNSTAHRQFLTKLLTQLESLPARINVSAELADVRGRLNQYAMMSKK
ncbi:MAG: GSCFA domain-containing protein [Spirosoma sp.]|nr:GSCFA domain-containing protein [Spirosoma sp.]